MHTRRPKRATSRSRARQSRVGAAGAQQAVCSGRCRVKIQEGSRRALKGVESRSQRLVRASMHRAGGGADEEGDGSGFGQGTWSRRSSRPRLRRPVQVRALLALERPPPSSTPHHRGAFHRPSSSHSHPSHTMRSKFKDEHPFGAFRRWRTRGPSSHHPPASAQRSARARPSASARSTLTASPYVRASRLLVYPT
jgi:hypothetical protein